MARFGDSQGTNRRMPDGIGSNNRGRISPRESRKLKLLVFVSVILVALICLIAHIYYINRVHGLEYQKAVLSNQSYDTTVIPFRRGDIVDCNGTVLATSEKVYNLVIDPYTILYYDNDPYLEPTLRELGSHFEDLDMSFIRSYINNNQDSRYYVALRRLTYDQIADFLAVMDSNDYVRGVTFEEEYKRIYPNGSLASTILGFTRKNGTEEGQYGIEEYYNDSLTGTDGREYGYQNDDGSLERTVKDAVDGYTVHSTIDAVIQSIIERVLYDFNEQYKNNYREGNGAENIGCIIQNVNTGEILGMCDFPTYDPNNYGDTDPLLGMNLIEAVENAAGYTEYHKTSTIITQDIVDSLEDSQLTVNLSSLWKNFTITNTYEPGSTAKPFTVAAALEDGTITGNEVYACNGSLEVGDHTIKCHTYASGGDGAVSVSDSIAWSCNVALMKIGMAMGKNEFCDFQKTFNFGLKTNIDLAGEARTASLVYSPSDMLPTDLATNTFGQNFDVTMIQMITGFSSLINGGYYYEPHIVNKITNSSGATIANIEPRVLKQTVSETTSAKIREYTRATVMPEGGDRRTGKTARPAGYAIGGKTGTAETLPRGNREYVVSFMGYAPADNPQIAIYVVVDRPNVAKQDDAKYATVIVRDILTEVLPYLNIYMTEELSQKEIAELEAKELEITLRYTGGESTETVTTDKEDGITSGNIIDSTGESVRIYPIWMTYPIDPNTGYRVDPDTGKRYDASTGEPIDDNESMLDGVPTNGNLSEGQSDSGGSGRE